MYCWLCAHATFDIMCFSALVRASGVLSRFCWLANWQLTIALHVSEVGRWGREESWQLPFMCQRWVGAGGGRADNCPSCVRGGQVGEGGERQGGHVVAGGKCVRLLGTHHFLLFAPPLLHLLLPVYLLEFPWRWHHTVFLQSTDRW